LAANTTTERHLPFGFSPPFWPVYRTGNTNPFFLCAEPFRHLFCLHPTN
jgi:hypothetical protein